MREDWTQRKKPTAPRRLLCAALSLVALPFAARAEGPWFVDVASDVGLSFVGEYGAIFEGYGGGPLMAQRNTGNGATVGDYDRDGDLDVYFAANWGKENRLFRNDLDLGTKAFTDITDFAGVGDRGLTRTVQFADLDNDGWLDLLVVNDDDGSGRPSRIFKNEADGTFTDVTANSGFDPMGLMRVGLGLADFDGDGLLDVYVSNWSQEAGLGKGSALPGSNRLYHNLGNFRFLDVTLAMGLGVLSRDSFTPIFFDFNDDLRPDLYVAVDHTEDEFFWNVDGKQFRNATKEVNLAHTGNDMGVACADFDDDGDLDLYVTNITDKDGIFGTLQFNAFHINQFDSLGTVTFKDEALLRGVEDSFWGWGTSFTDLENDGDLDIVAVSGFDEWLLFLLGRTASLTRTPAVMFVNDVAGFFEPRRLPGIPGDADSRALLPFDYDRDGDQDLLITNVGQPVNLLENRSEPSGHWLAAEVEQVPGQNRDGVGVSVYATIGATIKRRDFLMGGSYLSGPPMEVHFGLGDADKVDKLRVRWTDGSEAVFENVAVNRHVRIVQGVADADLDGVADATDNCPAVINERQTDLDRDGTGDACEVAGSEPAAPVAGDAKATTRR